MRPQRTCAVTFSAEFKSNARAADQQHGRLHVRRQQLLDLSTLGGI
jgi:hypothetical protein